MRSAAAQHFALPLGAEQRRILQVLAMNADAEVAQQSENDDQDEEYRSHQFPADASSQPMKPAAGERTLLFLHGVISPRRSDRFVSPQHEQAPPIRCL